MADLSVYQIGVQGVGRYGFEKLVDMANHLKETDVEVAGVAEKDPERREDARKFAESNGLEIETFKDPSEMYREAESKENVMIYDAGGPAKHPSHIHESLKRGFFHVSERPPSMTREQHLQEKKLAENHDLMWKVDFIERESAVVQKALELTEGKDIESVKVFRENTSGLKRVLDPVKYGDVKGGDILDQMINDIYVLDLLDISEKEGFVLESAESFFMPRGTGSESMMELNGGKTREIEKAATGRTSAEFETSQASVELNSSWIGASREVSSIVEKYDIDLVQENYVKIGEQVIRDQRCNFFIVEGEARLLGDILNGRLYDIDSGEEIEVPDLLHDQLYRFLKKTVLNASGEREDEVSDRETELFIDRLFDVRDQAVENSGSYFDELDRSQELMKKLMVEDKNIPDPETNRIAG